jgi:hypothetical protein
MVDKLAALHCTHTQFSIHLGRRLRQPAADFPSTTIRPGAGQHADFSTHGRNPTVTTATRRLTFTKIPSLSPDCASTVADFLAPTLPQPKIAGQPDPLGWSRRRKILQVVNGKM